ncbi:hypothetical protein B0H16DRAFT_351354 [Mycena metata]|uniref:C2H2-type domain-containing protein n=1 Tax=Mycena metata TaxID=1033252 RepID=A0AAD7JLK1_9AGAR|nr:hypothetical protein B0H16DRAFT_351354 [Mycena metata]
MVPTPWDAGLLNVPGPMYREWHGSSFSGSETSSNAPHSPNPQWDHPSPSVGSDHGVEVNLSSQRWTTDSSGRPEHPDNNDQFDEMIRQFQLSDAFSPREASTWRHSSQGRHDISVPDLSPQDILPHDEHQPGFRRVVATPATRRAAKFRRKKAASFVCMVCGADFTANHNLKNHLNSHRSIKGFRCDQCAQCFGTAHVLRRHLKKCKKRLQGMHSTTRAQSVCNTDYY